MKDEATLLSELESSTYRVFAANLSKLLTSGSAYCESPIERVFLAGLWSVFLSRPTAYPGFSVLRAGSCTEDYLDPEFVWEDPGVFVLPQLRIGSYRVDFAIAYVWPNRTVNAVTIVEVDGHQFHERTKEQAARDKSRDRQFAAQDWRVMRFAGSEIWRDPFMAAYEALEAASSPRGEPWCVFGAEDGARRGG